MTLEIGLDGKAALVTGASRGMGAATAEELAELGARVVMVGRDEAALREVAAKIGGEVSYLVLDLTDPASLEPIVAAGHFDVIVNNAGASTAKRFEDVAPEDWQHQWDLNVIMPLRIVQAFYPEMARRGWGRVVNVASAAGKRPTPLHGPYSVGKSAQLALSRVLAEEYGRSGVLVNAVCPGPIASPFWMDEGGTADQVAAINGVTREEVLATVEAGTPLGRWGDSSEVAKVIAFLCTDAASFVTGAAWSADGGVARTIV